MPKQHTYLVSYVRVSDFKKSELTEVAIALRHLVVLADDETSAREFASRSNRILTSVTQRGRGRQKPLPISTSVQEVVAAMTLAYGESLVKVTQSTEELNHATVVASAALEGLASATVPLAAEMEVIGDAVEGVFPEDEPENHSPYHLVDTQNEEVVELEPATEEAPAQVETEDAGVWEEGDPEQALKDANLRYAATELPLLVSEDEDSVTLLVDTGELTLAEEESDCGEDCALCSLLAAEVHDAELEAEEQLTDEPLQQESVPLLTEEEIVLQAQQAELDRKSVIAVVEFMVEDKKKFLTALGEQQAGLEEEGIAQFNSFDELDRRMEEADARYNLRPLAIQLLVGQIGTLPSSIPAEDTTLNAVLDELQNDVRVNKGKSDLRNAQLDTIEEIVDELTDELHALRFLLAELKGIPFTYDLVDEDPEEGYEEGESDEAPESPEPPADEEAHTTSEPGRDVPFLLGVSVITFLIVATSVYVGLSALGPYTKTALLLVTFAVAGGVGTFFRKLRK